MTELATELRDDQVTLELFGAEHVDPLRASVAKDQDIWEIYPINLNDADSEKQLEAFHGGEDWVRYAVMVDGALVGTTSYISPDPANGTVMIGGTYLEPGARGTGVNVVMKRLMLNHAFACGYWRVEFTIDTRNKRSMAAAEKLGAKREGILRKNRVTWTGYVRDTALYSILKDEWGHA